MIVAVRVERVTLDTSSNRFVVILKDDTYHRWLPIVVGPAEAQAIALPLEKVNPPRPMTHDLMKNLLDSIKTNIARVIVNDLKENTYYATIDLKRNGSQMQVDARPSDAIALALRAQAPIFVDEGVMQKAAIGEEMESIEPLKEEDEIKSLNVQLQEAVKEERYEDAARIRDMINELQEKMKVNKKQTKTKPKTKKK
jgi:bifunctional DNase/RNase